MILKNQSTIDSVVKYIILISIPLAFVLSDWMIDLFSFGEIIMVFTLIPLSIKSSSLLKKSDWQIFFIFELVLLFSVLSTILFNEEMIIKPMLAGVLKLTFFLTYVLMAARYIKEKNLEDKLISMFNGAAILTLLIGSYIFVILQFDLSLPFEFFLELWKIGLSKLFF